LNAGERKKGEDMVEEREGGRGRRESWTRMDVWVGGVGGRKWEREHRLLFSFIQNQWKPVVEKIIMRRREISKTINQEIGHMTRKLNCIGGVGNEGRAVKKDGRETEQKLRDKPHERRWSESKIGEKDHTRMQRLERMQNEGKELIQSVRKKKKNGQEPIISTAAAGLLRWEAAAAD